MEDLWLYLFLLQVLASLGVLVASKLNEGTKVNGLSAITALFAAMLALAWYAQSFVDFLLLATYGIWILSLGRLLESKQSQAYINYITFRDSKYFLLLCTFLLMLNEINPTLAQFTDLYMQMVLLISFLIAVSVVISLQKYRFKRFDEDVTESQKLPTITLAIPARNETHALQESLQAALTSDYEKLEILVLDDCSQDATADVIRSFAHDGVRFVQGAETAEGWIGKNQAYKTLLEHASGDVVIFCGVDVHLSVSSISQLVSYYNRNKLKMLSVMPLRQNTDFLAHIIQPVRHFWQFAFPRFVSSTPSVISSCWVVDRKELQKAGGFGAVHNSLVPEAYFARKLNELQEYAFIYSDFELGITTRKQVSSQIDTALRTTYPILKRSFAVSWLVLMSVVSVFIIPFLIALMSAINSQPSYMYIAIGLYTLSHILILTKIATPSLVTSLITFPLSMVAQVILIATSAIMYEYGEISWKGRNVCIPALQYSKKD